MPIYLHIIINISDSCLNCYELLNWLGWRGNFWCKFGVVGTFSLFASLLSPSILFMDLICQRIWINLKCFTLSRCGVQNQSICHLFSLICHPIHALALRFNDPSPKLQFLIMTVYFNCVHSKFHSTHYIYSWQYSSSTVKTWFHIFIFSFLGNCIFITSLQCNKLWQTN